MLDRFAKLLGIRPDQAEDALRSERAAKHVVSRRSFFGAAAALATGAIFSFGGVEAAEQIAPNPLLEQLHRAAREIRKFRPYPPAVFMNPHDYDQLRTMLPELTFCEDEGLVGPRVIADHHVAPGSVYAAPKSWLDSFSGIDLAPFVAKGIRIPAGRLLT